MKRTRNTFAILTALLALMLLSTCDHTKDGQGETGTFTINLGGTSRAAFPPKEDGNTDPLAPSEAELRFEVIFTEVGSSTVRSFSFNGGQNASGRIAVGTYVVTMNIRFIAGNTPYAQGVAVNNPITITSGTNEIEVLVYNPAGALPPVIHIQPKSAGYDFEATAAALTVEAESLDGTITGYQWYSNTTNSNTGGNSLGTASGADTASFTPDIFIYTAMSMYYYVEITNTRTSDGQTKTVTSNTAQISIVSAPVIVEYTPSGGTMTARPFLNLGTALTSITEAGDYTVRIRETPPVPLITFTGAAIRNITLRPEPTTSQVTVEFSANGNLITVPSDVKLTLERGITLQGHTGNTGPVVLVNSGGELVMMNGSKIIGNTNGATGGIGGGGVRVMGGTFNMEGGEISENTAAEGGGVSVESSGTFNMWNDALITKNIASSSSPGVGGGGVRLTGAIFNMHGGEITNNEANISAGGVSLRSSSTFTMHNGLISGNEAIGDVGGGVYLNGNSANTFFIMHGGEISGNKAPTAGGGLSMSEGNFRKEPDSPSVTSGIITGSNGPNPNSVVGSVERGHAVYVSTGATFRRNTTVTETQNLYWDGTAATPPENWVD